MNTYPEHEKLDKVKDQTQELGFFMEWLMQRYKFCVWHDTESEELTSGPNDTDPLIIYNPEGYYPANPNIQKVLAEYFEIDYDKLMAEKDQMLKDIRKANS